MRRKRPYMESMFEPYLHRWHLVPDGDPIETHTSSLLPVRQAGRKAMLKLARVEEERRGGFVMAWWAGVGAAPVLAHAGEALLMERAEGEQSLSQMARTGRDEEACRILCATAWRLHAPRRQPLPDLVPLAQIFLALEPAARTHGGILERCSKAADLLLATPKDIVVLHGDLHHGNVLDFRDRGWMAIDPKGFCGERGFDFANIFTNPDLCDARIPVATDPQRFSRRLAVVCEAASLDRERLLLWILAWCGLSWAWFIEGGDPAPINRAVAELAAAQLAA